MVANMNIYVGNLSLDVTEEEIRREFMTFGVVLSVVMMNDKYIGSGQSKGYGFVEMASISEGQAAVAGLKGTVINNRKINVVEALPLNRKITSLFKKRANKVRERAE
jgi:RNA recognition motif-containing protein